VEIFSPGERSLLRGPLLLQRPIPGVTLTHPDGYVKQVVLGGSILDYRYKLYGDINISINGDILADGYHAWKMDETYDALWVKYMETPWTARVRNVSVTPSLLTGMVDSFDLVINTAPASNFCIWPAHSFQFKQVAIKPETQVEDQPENTIYFNADPNVDWVRSSLIFGHRVTEWPIDRATPFHKIISKPISTDCDCNPRVLRTGRFGAWKNETWVPDAYYQTREALLSSK